MEIYFNELKKKDVLDVTTGRNLGKITDLVIDVATGKIIKIVVPGRRGAFLSCDNLEIKFKCITKVGDDVILVNFDSCTPHAEKCLEKECECQKKEPCCSGDRFCDE